MAVQCRAMQPLSRAQRRPFSVSITCSSSTHKPVAAANKDATFGENFSATQRRSLLAAIATSGLAAVALPAFADNAAVTGSLSRYVKRKRTESIETYVPPVLAARDQLIRVGRIMLQNPNDARQLLRSGSFAGLRSSVKAVGEYAAEHGLGKGAGAALIAGFFKELERLDGALLQAERSPERKVGEETKEALAQQLGATIAALDKILEALPEDALERARKVVNSVETLDFPEEAVEGGEGTAVDAAEVERLGRLY